MKIREFSEGIANWTITKELQAQAERLRMQSTRPMFGYGSDYYKNPANFDAVSLSLGAHGDHEVVVSAKVGYRGQDADYHLRARVTGTPSEPDVSFECPCGSHRCVHAMVLWEAARTEFSADQAPASLIATLDNLARGWGDPAFDVGKRPPQPTMTFGLVLKPQKASAATKYSVPVNLVFFEPLTGLEPKGYRPTKEAEDTDLRPDALSLGDASKVALLRQTYGRRASNERGHGSALPKDHGLIDSYAKEAIFEDLLSAKRVFMKQFGSHPLIYAEPILPKPQWVRDEVDDGIQQLVLADAHGTVVDELIRLRSLWAFNRTTRVMRRVLGDEALIEKVNRKRLVALSTQVAPIRAYMTRTGVAPVIPLPAAVSPARDVHGPATAVLRGHIVKDPEGTACPTAILTFDYDGTEVSPAAFSGEGRVEIRTTTAVTRIHRDSVLHGATIEAIIDAGLQFRDRRLLGGTGRRGDAAQCINAGGVDIDDVQHFAQALDLCEAADMRVIRSDDLQARDIDTQAYHTITVSSDDAFDLDVGITVDGVPYSLAEVMAATLADQRFPMKPTQGEEPAARWTVRLSSGALVRIPLADLRTMLAPVAEWLDAGDRRAGGKIRLTRIQAALAANEVGANAPPVLRDVRKALKRLVAISQEPLPETSSAFVGELRHYQREGLRWLNALADAGIGGVLGDDMGLGKTLQLIAHVLHLKDTGRLDEPALVIVPTSVAPTWAQACASFAPSLKVEVLHGSGRDRVHQRAREADVLITTYGTAVKDIDRLESQHFALVVADESQNAKNPRTTTAKALRRLKATRHINLTGTPLENRLLDLWSQLDMAAPGLLGGEKAFTRAIAAPIEKRGSELHRQALTRRIAPFLLRRTKEQVASELPPKTVSTVAVELGPAQRALYETLRATQHAAVLAAIAEHGLNRCGVEVLDALLKLRQVCCDPALAPMASAKKVKASAKMDALMELVSEAIDGGHRMLVFSSFTTMLDRIAARLQELGIGYAMLTGQTTHRGAVVDAFQSGDAPVFLLSLKAGGVGLNLTAADTVIHYDPWWNPAAEDQATDRAHRIGQDKAVNVYRLIAKDTVEERIELLKARKAALADAILNGEGEASFSWSAEDINHLFGA